MLDIPSLWVPILVASGLVWVAGAVIWMIMPWHKTDFGPLDDELAVANVLRHHKPGQYNIPHIEDPKEMASDANKGKWLQGPVAFITILPNGMPPMGKGMAQSFLFYLVTSIMVAYLAGRTALPSPTYLEIFQVAGAVAFVAYGFAFIQDAIWFGRPWSNIFKGLLDALIYACVTGGVFGWLWPGM